jgi:hypothetical protein
MRNEVEHFENPVERFVMWCFQYAVFFSNNFPMNCFFNMDAASYKTLKLYFFLY